MAAVLCLNWSLMYSLEALNSGPFFENSELLFNRRLLLLGVLLSLLTSLTVGWEQKESNLLVAKKNSWPRTMVTWGNVRSDPWRRFPSMHWIMFYMLRYERTFPELFQSIDMIIIFQKSGEEKNSCCLLYWYGGMSRSYFKSLGQDSLLRNFPTSSIAFK